MSHYHRRSGEQFHSGLRRAIGVSQSGRVRYSARWRHRLRGCAHYALLRLAAGKGDRLGTHAGGNDHADAPRAVGIPDSRRAHEPAVPVAVARASEVSVGRIHDHVHRRYARAVAVSRTHRRRQQAVELRRRRGGERESRGAGSSCAGRASHPESAGGEQGRAAARHETTVGRTRRREVRAMDAEREAACS